MLGRDGRSFIGGRLLRCLGLALILTQVAPGAVPAEAPAGKARPAPPPPAAKKPPAAQQSFGRAPIAKKPKVAIPVHTELDIQRWLRPGEYAWNDEGVPAGPTTIVVNLRGRVMSVYRAGFEIGRSSIIYGDDEKPTPTGRFKILQKRADHISNIYGTPMPYMQRLTMDGISIHAGTMADDRGTNGCVGLPKEFARLLFSATKIGDQVHIWQG